MQSRQKMPERLLTTRPCRSWLSSSAPRGAQPLPQSYVSRMTTILGILLLIVMLGVVGVLGAGMVGVAKGGNARRSNALMRSRVLLQGVALVLIVLILIARSR